MQPFIGGRQIGGYLFGNRKIATKRISQLVPPVLIVLKKTYDVD
jgi:hypothetical protein